MAEKVTIGNAALWHGDCREILPALSVGSIVTSPPYGVGKEYERGGRLEWLALMSGFFAATDAEIVVLNLADVRCHEDKLIAPVRADVAGRKNAVTAQDVIDAAIAGKGRNKKEIAEAPSLRSVRVDANVRHGD
ncbi:MAG: site-specific DNA-methyltransferase [Rhodocyclaceae bacterium]|nr:site-specific DNA-methyltransferase [Rhodocyclaceae bacterium]